MKLLEELYAYRDMIKNLIKRDLKGRYKGSVLGFAWTFLNPLLQLAVYTMVFSIIMRNGIEDYYLYLFVALIPWIFFSSSLSGGAGCIRAQADLTKKIYFPREVIPISFVTSQFINMCLSLLVVFAVLILSGKGISLIALLYLPIIMIIEYFIALGMTLLLSGITVYFRDVEYFVGILMMAWQFSTPVMYGIDMVPERFRIIFNANPMTSIIVAYRDILYYKQAPDLSTLITAIAFAVVIVGVGIYAFSKLKRHFAEEL